MAGVIHHQQQGVLECTAALAAFTKAFGLVQRAPSTLMLSPFDTGATFTYTEGRGNSMRSLFFNAVAKEGATGIEEDDFHDALGLLQKWLRDMSELIDRAQT
jgi:hypothetical protein